MNTTHAFLLSVLYGMFPLKMTRTLHLLTEWGSPHGTLDPDPMRIGDSDPKTALPPHNLDPDPSCVLCCVGSVREIQSIRAHARPHWIWIGNQDPVNPVSVPVWRAPLSYTNWTCLVWCKVYPGYTCWITVIFETEKDSCLKINSFNIQQLLELLSRNVFQMASKFCQKRFLKTWFFVKQLKILHISDHTIIVKISPPRVPNTYQIMYVET